MSLMNELGNRAIDLGIPLGVQLDLTYRCNERCVHCYLDHEDHGEMTTAEVKDVLDQLAEAGTFFLTLSGGEIFMRRDLFEIIGYARALTFSVKLKTNAVMVSRAKAERIAALGVESVQVSLYSHKPEVHDEITKLPGSFKRTMAGARALKAAGVKVSFANVLMKHNADDYPQVRALCEELDIEYKADATITPMMDGDRSVLALNVDPDKLAQIYRDDAMVGDSDEYCAPPAGPLEAEDALNTLPCSAGHSAAYISPYGEVFPCVQFPLLTGNVRESRFIDIWRHSPQFADVRSIRVSDLQGCSACVHGSSCSRCPGLAFTEGNMRGPSIQDCERSYARTGVASKNLLAHQAGAGAGGTRPVFWLTQK
jgi:radical SAM protein with 4Fe4S-binding SPASM domain